MTQAGATTSEDIRSKHTAKLDPYVRGWTRDSAGDIGNVPTSSVCRRKWRRCARVSRARLGCRRPVRAAGTICPAAV